MGWQCKQALFQGEVWELTERMACMQGPFTFEALSPADITFRPLKQTREFNARELLQVGCLSACS